MRLIHQRYTNKATLRILFTLLGLTATSQAATIHLQGRILGLSTPTNPSLSTLDYYWFTVDTAAILQVSLSFLGVPLTQITELDLTFYSSPNANGDVFHHGKIQGNTSRLAAARCGEQ